MGHRDEYNAATIVLGLALTRYCEQRERFEKLRLRMHT